MGKTLYVECTVSKGVSRKVLWLPQELAVVDSTVSLKSQDGHKKEDWLVESTDPSSARPSHVELSKSANKPTKSPKEGALR